MNTRLLSRLRRRLPSKMVTDHDSYERLIATTDPASVAAESYRALRTNLLYAFVDSPPRVIVTTSPGNQEGKTTTCANLGAMLSQVNKTLIVDCDLRQPAMHRVFGVRNIYGIADVLAGMHTLHDVCHEPMPGLQVLTSGLIPPNPAELLSSEHFAEFITQVRQQYDYVLVDTPPVQSGSVATVVAHLSDGVLLVVDAQNTRKSSVRASVRSLRAVEARILGTVMNNVKVSKQASRSGSYSYIYEG